MKILALTVALLLAVSPVAAQQQQALGAGGQINNSILPNTGLICIEEMVATFCNVPTGPNTRGFGSSATSGTSATSRTSAGAGVGAVSNSSTSTTSIHPCGAFPPPNELCN
jgi:hypothetical protein